jgi:hypothetical protein
MPSEAIAAVRPEPGSVANLEYYRKRDEFFRAYLPATEEEKLLVTQMMRAWQHLEDVYELRTHLTAGKGLTGLFQEDLDTYKRLMRDLGAAERMWRHALTEFRRASRRRNQSADPRPRGLSTVSFERPPTVPSPEPRAARTDSEPAFTVDGTNLDNPLTETLDEQVLNSEAQCHKIGFGRREKTPSSQAGFDSETRCAQTACRDGDGALER